MTFPRFRNLSINTKLAASIIFSCLLISLLASSFFIGQQIFSHRRSMIEDLTGLAKVIGINCAAPLEFMDQETAGEVLSSLSARPHILQAVLVTADNQIFAEYHTPSLSSQDAQELFKHVLSKNTSLHHESHHFYKSHINLSVPIGEPGKSIGTLILQSDQDEYQAILARLLYAVCGIFAATLLLASFFSFILNRVISRPILSLAETMERVRREENYSIRVIKNSEDELGVLVKGINSMLQGIERRDEQLLVAKKVAENANMAKSHFLAQMSHEIRTPMNGVLGIASLLLNTSLNKKQSEFVRTIRKSGKSLLNLINDILDFSKIEAGKLELEWINFNLREIIEETVDMLTERAGEKHINLACVIQSTAPPYVMGDPGRLRQILLNLLGNAIKFTHHGEILLHVSSKSKENQDVHLHFEIRDSGIGIEPKKQKEIFTAFSQADGSTTRQFGGTGLGLAICQQLVHLMNGEIGVRSVAGQGATFWFTTVLAIGEAEESSTDAQKLIVTKKFNASILVAEDNVTNQIVARGMLEQFGCRVDLAENGMEAVITAEKEQYDLIFMDCQMPVMDGYEATENIRKMEKQAGKRQTPIIALTAYAMKGDKERCLGAGMDDYIPKPFNEEHLLSMLSAWLPDESLTMSEKTVSIKGKKTNEQSSAIHIDRNTINNLSQLQQPGKPDFINRLVTIYLQSSPEILQALNQAAKNNDIERLWQSAHSLKSSSASLGANRLSSLCHELEILGRENRLANPTQNLWEIETEYTAVTAELERILAEK